MKTHILKAAVFAMAVLSVSSFGQSWYYDNTTYPPYQFIAPYSYYPVMCPWFSNPISGVNEGTVFLGDYHYYIKSKFAQGVKIGAFGFGETNGNEAGKGLRWISWPFLKAAVCKTSLLFLSYTRRNDITSASIVRHIIYRAFFPRILIGIFWV